MRSRATAERRCTLAVCQPILCRRRPNQPRLSLEQFCLRYLARRGTIELRIYANHVGSPGAFYLN